MSLVTVIAIEPCNEYRPGERFAVSEREARELLSLGLIKMGVPPQNKMREEPVNKANPSPAAGVATPSSSAPAVQASHVPTAQPSRTGKRRGRSPGRSLR